MQERTRMGFIIREDNYPNCFLQKEWRLGNPFIRDSIPHLKWPQRLLEELMCLLVFFFVLFFFSLQKQIISGLGEV